MNVSAKISFLRISPKKVRLVADVVRKMTVVQAEQQLTHLNKKAARPLLQLLRSAVANAEHNHKLKKDNLIIKELRVDEGPVAKRWMPKAFGRANPIRKKSAHVIVTLEEIIQSPVKHKKSDDHEFKQESNKDDFAEEKFTDKTEIREKKPVSKPQATKVPEIKKTKSEQKEPNKKNILKRVFKGRAKDVPDQ